MMGQHLEENSMEFQTKMTLWIAAALWIASVVTPLAMAHEATSTDYWNVSCSWEAESENYANLEPIALQQARNRGIASYIHLGTIRQETSGPNGVIIHTLRLTASQYASSRIYGGRPYLSVTIDLNDQEIANFDIGISNGQGFGGVLLKNDNTYSPFRDRWITCNVVTQ